MQIKEIQSLYLQSPKLNQLNILREVACHARITQAELASHCSLSVAMVNNYMKELCAGNMLEYHRKTTKSVTYHLTPSGARYLESLQLELIKEMVDMFVAAKEQIRVRIVSQAQVALQRVVLYGSGHLAQLAFHALEQVGASILGVCDDNPAAIGADFCGREVLSPTQIRFIAPDAVIIADSLRTQEICQSLSSLTEKGISLIRLDNCNVQKIGELQKAQSSIGSVDRVNGALVPFSVPPTNSHTSS
jgi:DNA-binding MarR family transcriptional regulator